MNTGLYINNTELKQGDLIGYTVEDPCEKSGEVLISGNIHFENGAFVVKSPDFKHYNWDDTERRPDLLYDWLKEDGIKLLEAQSSEPNTQQS